MTQFKNAMEIFKLLNMTNCRDCNEKTCLAFASAVYLGKKRLNECPYLDSEIILQNEAEIAQRHPIVDEQGQIIKKLQEKIKSIDLAATADRVGGTFADNRLTIKVMGKNFRVLPDGSLSSDIHINPWVAVPLLSYILNCSEQPISGKWVTFRELENGKTWHGLFRQRCELDMKKVADNYTVLFEDMVDIFNGQKVGNHHDADISVVLHPLPKVPVLISYWKPEDGLESDLTLFFDRTAEGNCGIQAIYTLGVGLVEMFRKIVLRHGI
ncbi:MAG: DUF3786 domain-containing protein [Desulfosalsimonadaceae bacterium]|nr:DUF3786 domain-containing protein [Desulfosalsimonadaceae bacterium]